MRRPGLRGAHMGLWEKVKRLKKVLNDMGMFLCLLAGASVRAARETRVFGGVYM